MSKILMGVSCAGLKASGDPDVLVVLLPKTCQASFLFTDNHFKSGSILYSQKVFRKKGKLRAFVVNSGNANCGTGKEGEVNAKRVAERVAEKLEIDPEEVLVFSTGVIGKPLPMEKVLSAVEEACSDLKPLDLELASRTIGTTDRFPKFGKAKEGNLEVFGFAKGAGMIDPSMATMLAFVFTNAKLSKEELTSIHREVCERTFNSITVDGCKSTNDSFGLIALGEVEADTGTLKRLLEEVSLHLAKKIVEDGEGATRIIKVTVRGASLKIKAKEIARAVASSLLVKTAVYGRDPNWGRILAAAGSTKFPIDPFKVKVYVGGHLLYDGKPCPEAEKEAKRHMEEEKEVDITVDLGEGSEVWTYYSSDLGYEYIRINAEYRT